jgi:glycosyltransferase involved in cell wall biosynthesis
MKSKVASLEHESRRGNQNLESLSYEVKGRENRPELHQAAPAVVMLVSNPFDPDPRVYREAKSLVDNDVPVEVIGWDRLGTSVQHEVVDGIKVRRIKIASGYGGAGVFALTLPLFWIYAFGILLSRRITVIHCHDFDTLPVGIALKALKGCSVVFDAHEFYPAYVRDYVSKLTYSAINTLHSILYKRAEVIFTVSEQQKPMFQHKQVAVIPNLPRVKSGNANRDRQKSDGTFTIFYYGGLTTDRGIDQILEIPRLLESAMLVISGRGPLEDLVISISKREHKVRYLGWISTAEIEENLASCDYVPILYDPKNLNNATGTPNKLFDSLKFGAIPIVPEGTFMAQVVRKKGIGIVVPYNNIATLAKQVEELERDTKLKARIQKSGREVFLKEYNWNVGEERLLSIYHQLLVLPEGGAWRREKKRRKFPQR